MASSAPRPRPTTRTSAAGRVASRVLQGRSDRGRRRCSRTNERRAPCRCPSTVGSWPVLAARSCSVGSAARSSSRWPRRLSPRSRFRGGRVMRLIEGHQARASTCVETARIRLSAQITIFACIGLANAIALTSLNTALVRRAVLVRRLIATDHDMPARLQEPARVGDSSDHARADGLVRSNPQWPDPRSL